MKKYNKKLNTNEDIKNEDEVDIYSMPVAVERVEAGLIGNLKINDEINYPIFKKGDLIRLRAPSKLNKKDFVLYQTHDEYFLRRIIKFKDDGIYVAGDNEHEYHVIQKSDVVAKVLSRERKNKSLSFSLTPKKKLYTFKKVSLCKFRLGNRISTYESDLNNESLELAQQAVENKTVFTNNTQQINTSIDLDSELSSFLNPDVLVQELRDAMAQGDRNDQEQVTDSQSQSPNQFQIVSEEDK